MPLPRSATYLHVVIFAGLDRGYILVLYRTVQHLSVEQEQCTLYVVVPSVPEVKKRRHLTSERGGNYIWTRLRGGPKKPALNFGTALRAVRAMPDSQPVRLAQEYEHKHEMKSFAEIFS